VIYRRHLRQSPQPRFIRALLLPVSPLNLQLLTFNLLLFLPFRFSSSTFNRFLINVPFPKFFPCHTSENSPVSPGIATDPKTPFSKSCICHTSETPRGRFSTFQPSTFQQFKRFLELSPFFSNSSTLFWTFLRSREIQLFSFQAIPHSSPKTTRVGGVTNHQPSPSPFQLSIEDPAPPRASRGPCRDCQPPLPRSSIDHGTPFTADDSPPGGILWVAL
jgi:hypothetical protein